MANAFPLEERSINDIYLNGTESVTYTIPIYQRNYAWEEDEITALIKDVYDACQNKKEVYYIGTLVTYKHSDNVYEVIDGQQRLTTIYIILKALCKELGNHEIKIKNKLTYSARKSSASTIQALDAYPNLGENVDAGIKNGYVYADNAIKSVLGESDQEYKTALDEFTKYFCDNVHIIHYKVPKDVDLNHYFEVMNSRGEQLELHEIVKSKLGSYLKDDKTALATFCHVWEACSEMNIYIQQAYSSTDDVNREMFGDNRCQFKMKDFEGIPKVDASEGKDTIINLLQCSAEKLEDEAEKEKKDKFQPIIDFPNFLLIVLKLTRILRCDKNFEPAKFILDDKELVNEFEKALVGLTEEDKAEFAKQFAFNLLRAKFFLDNYIVHHSLEEREREGDNPWKLQCYYKDSSNKRYYKNLSSSTATHTQDEMVHLLSMFEVAFTAKQRKNYLFYCLWYLFSNEFVETDYLTFLQHLADKFFFDVYLNNEALTSKNQPRPNAFDNALIVDGTLNVDVVNGEGVDYKEKFNNIYKQGSMDIPLFIFNYTDYKLWKKYADEVRSKGLKKGDEARVEFFKSLGCSDFELDYFNNFYFSRTRKSLEHFYPRAKAGEGKPLSLNDINCFGNFAMIGSEANSSGSSWDPKTKLDHYKDKKYDQVSVASLKLKIMMQICKDNENENRESGMEWNKKDMDDHQENMLNVLFDKHLNR